jgi:hypothetical protein
MPIGSRKLIGTTQRYTAADEHATVSIAGAEITTETSKFGSHSLKTLNAVVNPDGGGLGPTGIGDCQITVYPKDSNFYLNSNHSWTVEWFLGAEGDQNATSTDMHARLAMIRQEKLSDTESGYLDLVPRMEMGHFQDPDARYTYYQVNASGLAPVVNSKFIIGPYPVWKHIAAVNEAGAGVNGNGRFTWYENGVLVNQTNYNYTASNRNFSFGGWWTVRVNGWDDALYYNDIRISNTARYTSSFSGTVPNKPFLPDINTLAIFHFNGNTNDSAF